VLLLSTRPPVRPEPGERRQSRTGLLTLHSRDWRNTAGPYRLAQEYYWLRHSILSYIRIRVSTLFVSTAPSTSQGTPEASARWRS
jgi:hypothetical protein